jgi:hypothetical protein
MINPRIFFRRAVGLCSALLLSALCHADAPGVLIRAAELKSEPFIDAGNVASLPDNTALSVLENKGGWSKIRTADGKAGWVRLLNVRPAKADEARSSGESLAQMGGVLRTGSTKSVATTGAKGLSKGDIVRAQPNPNEVRRLDDFKARPTEVDKFAATRKLVAQNVAELTP